MRCPNCNHELTVSIGLGRGDEAPSRATSRVSAPTAVSPETPSSSPPRSIKDELDEFVEHPEYIAGTEPPGWRGRRRLYRAVYEGEDVP